MGIKSDIILLFPPDLGLQNRASVVVDNSFAFELNTVTILSDLEYDSEDVFEDDSEWGWI